MEKVDLQTPVAPKAKLVMSALFSDPAVESPVLAALEREVGRTDLISERIPFRHSRYYEAEMGANIHRRMISFSGLIASDELIGAKHRAQQIEHLFRDAAGNRRCNLDPGVVGLHNFVLATHKDYTHRIYLGRGVYGDLALIYHSGGYRALQWTYPDYASSPIIDVLNLVRAIYIWQMKRQSRGDADAS